MHFPRIRTPVIAASAVVIGVAVVVPLVGLSPSASGVMNIFTATADTRVMSARPATNYGLGPQLGVDASAAQRTFLKFNVSGVSGPVTSATLRLHVDDMPGAQSNNGGTYQLMTNATWAETGPTWNSQPAIGGTTLGSIGAVFRNTWVELDVTGKITGNGTFSVGITSSSADGAYFDSRETALAPQLVLDTGSTTPTPAPPGDPVLVGAGDISHSGVGDSATAALLDHIVAEAGQSTVQVFTTGDNVYTSGTTTQFDTLYHPTWGRHKEITRPSPGNHDYETEGAAGYYDYFGPLAGPSERGYYSYDLGTWHIVSLNTQIGMAAGSPQHTWLRNDLANSEERCALAYWHKPLFTSGPHGPGRATRPLFRVLYDHDAEVVVTGHNHNYERFAPMTPSGALARRNGVREFVAGMGGRSHYGFGTIQPNSQARNSNTYGVLKLTLRNDSYDWQFVPEEGKAYSDLGTKACH